MAEREAPIVLTDLEGEGSDSNLAYVCETHENVLMSIMLWRALVKGYLIAEMYSITVIHPMNFRKIR